MNSEGNIRRLEPADVPARDEIRLTEEQAAHLATLTHEERVKYYQTVRPEHWPNRKARRAALARHRAGGK